MTPFKTHPAGKPGIKVIIAALPRSGTLSAATALQILGYNPYHSIIAEEDGPTQEIPDRIRRLFWATQPYLSASSSSTTTSSQSSFAPTRPWTREDWDAEWGSHWDSVTELPAVLAADFWEAYPEAKVVVIRHDKARWLASMRGLFLQSYSHFLYHTLVQCVVIPFVGGVHKQSMRGDVFASFTRAQSRTARAISDGLPDAYDRYFEEIERRVPREKRIEFSHRDGWGPLCEFLGEKVPDQPYPHVNERATLAARQEALYRKYWAQFVVKLAAYAAPVAAGCWYGYANWGRLLPAVVDGLRFS